MLNSIKMIWGFFGRRSLSVWLLFLISIDLLAGSLIMRHNPSVFSGLSRVFLQEWIKISGIGLLNITWWFLLALLLLVFLSLNTFVCTVNRTYSIFKVSANKKKHEILLKLSPQIMHVGFIIVLTGLLVSHTAGTNLTNQIVQEGNPITIDDFNLKIELKNLSIKFEKETAFKALTGMPKSVCAVVSLSEQGKKPEKRTIAINRPLLFRGITFVLKDYYPKMTSSEIKSSINLQIKKDKGMYIQAAGALFFGSGLIAFVLQICRLKSVAQG